ncbi:MAG: hypothetical protein L0Y36_08875 [Planctomycetales bacterium]|nr:hypothetical protein [Planctomycetales bacterium]
MTLPPSLPTLAPPADRRFARDRTEAMAASIRRCSAMLDNEQKALLAMIFDRGNTLEQVAQLTGRHASTVSRQFGRLMRNLAGRETAAAFGAGRRLTPMEAAILREYYLHGVRQRQIARKLGCTLYRIRRTVLRIRRAVAAGPDRPSTV